MSDAADAAAQAIRDAEAEAQASAEAAETARAAAAEAVAHAANLGHETVMRAAETAAEHAETVTNSEERIAWLENQHREMTMRLSDLQALIPPASPATITEMAAKTEAEMETEITEAPQAAEEAIPEPELISPSSEAEAALKEAETAPVEAAARVKRSFRLI